MLSDTDTGLLTSNSWKWTSLLTGIPGAEPRPTGLLDAIKRLEAGKITIYGSRKIISSSGLISVCSRFRAF